ncbi:MAG TPA: hypothetical protein VFH15_10205 [Pyrinomonadaceae bacterium]|nr:hypothetical protein [Pyrinomonadaceae bacterium]
MRFPVGVALVATPFFNLPRFLNALDALALRLDPYGGLFSALHSTAPWIMG